MAAPMKYEGKGALRVATWSGRSGGQSSFPVLLLAGVYQASWLRHTAVPGVTPQHPTAAIWASLLSLSSLLSVLMRAANLLGD